MTYLLTLQLVILTYFLQVKDSNRDNYGKIKRNYITHGLDHLERLNEIMSQTVTERINIAIRYLQSYIGFRLTYYNIICI